jgi:hypothetical protein
VANLFLECSVLAADVLLPGKTLSGISLTLTSLAQGPCAITSNRRWAGTAAATRFNNRVAQSDSDLPGCMAENNLGRFTAARKLSIQRHVALA